MELSVTANTRRARVSAVSVGGLVTRGGLAWVGALEREGQL